MPREKLWSDTRILAGFERFFKEFGRYPTAQEINTYEHLPRTRTLQRSGRNGITAVREAFGLPITDYRKGAIRREVSLRISQRGLDEERSLGRLLEARFGKHFVHGQKPIGTRRRRVDFHVYAVGYEFDVDIFFPKDYDSFIRCLTIKMRGLEQLSHDLFFVAANPEITDDMARNYIDRRKTPLDPHIHILSYQSFLERINTLQRLYVAEDI